ncbi:hypothetical protein PR048_000135 [Dryococelus australis]|uniref:Uncharacterized protein n=1 Tax=Dryococelus australis TaxID=614101 RepID=A0ABQ9IDS7_9NEOP|nr:hypothetical protein PR048_000135 [Dryococelus australis]
MLADFYDFFLEFFNQRLQDIRIDIFVTTPYSICRQTSSDSSGEVRSYWFLRSTEQLLPASGKFEVTVNEIYLPGIERAEILIREVLEELLECVSVVHLSLQYEYLLLKMTSFFQQFVTKRGNNTGDTNTARLAPHRPYAQGMQCFRRDANILIQCECNLYGVQNILIQCECALYGVQNILIQCECDLYGVQNILIQCECALYGVQNILIQCECALYGVQNILIQLCWEIQFFLLKYFTCAQYANLRKEKHTLQTNSECTFKPFGKAKNGPFKLLYLKIRLSHFPAPSLNRQERSPKITIPGDRMGALIGAEKVASRCNASRTRTVTRGRHVAWRHPPSPPITTTTSPEDDFRPPSAYFITVTIRQVTGDRNSDRNKDSKTLDICEKTGANRGPLLREAVALSITPRRQHRSIEKIHSPHNATFMASSRRKDCTPDERLARRDDKANGVRAIVDLRAQTFRSLEPMGANRSHERNFKFLARMLNKRHTENWSVRTMDVIDDGVATAYLLHVYQAKPMPCLTSFNCACADRLFTLLCSDWLQLIATHRNTSQYCEKRFKALLNLFRRNPSFSLSIHLKSASDDSSVRREFERERRCWLFVTQPQTPNTCTLRSSGAPQLKEFRRRCLNRSRVVTKKIQQKINLLRGEGNPQTTPPPPPPPPPGTSPAGFAPRARPTPEMGSRVSYSRTKVCCAKRFTAKRRELRGGGVTILGGIDSVRGGIGLHVSSTARSLETDPVAQRSTGDEGISYGLHVGRKAVQCWDTEIGCVQPARSFYLMFSLLITSLHSNSRHGILCTPPLKAVHEKVCIFEINLRKKSLPRSAYVLTDALSDMRRVKLAEEYTTCIQVDVKQGFQKCSFYSEPPVPNFSRTAPVNFARANTRGIAERTGECCSNGVLRLDEGEGRSPRKPSDQRYRPARFPACEDPGATPDGTRTRFAVCEASTRSTTAAPNLQIWNYFPSIVTNFTERMFLRTPVKIHALRGSDIFFKVDFKSAQVIVNNLYLQPYLVLIQVCTRPAARADIIVSIPAAMEDSHYTTAVRVLVFGTLGGCSVQDGGVLFGFFINSFQVVATGSALRSETAMGLARRVNTMTGATLARIPAAMADLAQAFAESGIV